MHDLGRRRRDELVCMVLRITGSILCLKYVGILNFNKLHVSLHAFIEKRPAAVQDSICPFKYNEIYKAIYNLKQALLLSH